MLNWIKVVIVIIIFSIITKFEQQASQKLSFFHHSGPKISGTPTETHKKR